MKKFFLIISAVFLFLVPYFTPSRVSAANQVQIYFFWGKGCPHCTAEEEYFSTLKNDFPNITISEYEIWYNKDNQQLFSKVAERLNVQVSGVPFTVVGDKYFSGFSPSSTADQITQAVSFYSDNLSPDPIGDIIADNPKDQTTLGDVPAESARMKLPVLGEIDAKSFSLPVIAIVLGTLDGFNPCSLWVLLFLIGLLLELNDRKKMVILGSAFILAEALSYLLFMTAWLKIILFIGFILWIRIAIGVLAVGAGGWNLRELFKKNKDSGCDVVGEEKRKKTFSQIQKIAAEPKIYLALLGVAVLAFSVNIVEMVCSAGLPAMFSQILALNHLSGIGRFFYLLLYDFFFMIDDLIVFIGAIITLQLTGVTTKYSRWSHLIGGAVMVILGILLIFKPSWLMF